MEFDDVITTSAPGDAVEVRENVRGGFMVKFSTHPATGALVVRTFTRDAFGRPAKDAFNPLLVEGPNRVPADSQETRDRIAWMAFQLWDGLVTPLEARDFVCGL